MPRPTSLAKLINARMLASRAQRDAEEAVRLAVSPEELAAARSEAKQARATLRELDAIPKPPPRCGAKTRSGEPCWSFPVTGRKRCRMHGGASLRGSAHPKYVHGRRSVAEKEAAREAEAAAMRRAVSWFESYNANPTAVCARLFVDAFEELKELRRAHRARSRRPIAPNAGAPSLPKGERQS